MLEGVFAPDYKTSLPHTNGCVCVIDSSAAEERKMYISFYSSLSFFLLGIRYAVPAVPLSTDRWRSAAERLGQAFTHGHHRQHRAPSRREKGNSVMN